MTRHVARFKDLDTLAIEEYWTVVEEYQVYRFLGGFQMVNFKIIFKKWKFIVEVALYETILLSIIKRLVATYIYIIVTHILYMYWKKLF